MNMKINFNVNILPFNKTQVRIGGFDVQEKQEEEKKEKEVLRYGVPKTTVPQDFIIDFNKSTSYFETWREV